MQLQSLSIKPLEFKISAIFILDEVHPVYKTNYRLDVVDFDLKVKSGYFKVSFYEPVQEDDSGKTKYDLVVVGHENVKVPYEQVAEALIAYYENSFIVPETHTVH